MKERNFIAVHLRIGTDWVCKHCINEAYGENSDTINFQLCNDFNFFKVSEFSP